MRDSGARRQTSGFLKLHRSLTEWEWYDDPNVLAVWIHCLMSANWKDYRYHGETIPRGSFLTSYAKFAEECGIAVSTCRRCFEKLQSTGEITLNVTHRGTRVNVRRYAVFQGSEGEGWHTGDTTTDTATDTTGDTTTDTTADTLEKNIRREERKNIRREEIERENPEPEPEPLPKIGPGPTLSQIKQFVSENGLAIDPERFHEYYAATGWAGVTDWKARARAWNRNERKKKTETLPFFYNPEPIRDPDPKPASAEEIAEAYRALGHIGGTDENY